MEAVSIAPTYLVEITIRAGGVGFAVTFGISGCGVADEVGLAAAVGLAVGVMLDVGVAIGSGNGVIVGMGWTS